MGEIMLGKGAGSGALVTLSGMSWHPDKTAKVAKAGSDRDKNMSHLQNSPGPTRWGWQDELDLWDTSTAGPNS
jgi:hypothetical protein